MDGTSPDIRQQQLEKLKSLFPEVVSEGTIDWEKLHLTLGDDLKITDERYVLNWAGKSNAFRAIQTPTTATLKPKPEQSINFDTSENIFIEGENLDVLKVLQKPYYGKVKMIYIDPPYNTGNDSFIYPDKFAESKEEYLKRIGDKDEEGYLTKEGFFRKNSKDSGHYHSNWLSMMYPRLFLARNLLRDDGVIFVSIDDNEVHNLRLMMNEIFGEENFLASYLWRKKGTTTNVEGAKVSSLTEYVLCYGKSGDQGLNYRIIPRETRTYPCKDNEGNYRMTIIEKKNAGGYKRDTMQFQILGRYPREGKRWQIGGQLAKQLELKKRFTIDGDIVKLKIYDFEDKDTSSAFPNLLFEHGSTDSASTELNESIFSIPELFENPKPKELLIQLIKFAQSQMRDDIILDFFAGSGTTAHAVYEVNKEDGGNRKFILVQLPEKTEENSVTYQEGYETIASICRERIRHVIKKIEEEKNAQPDLFKSKPLDLGFKAFALRQSNFKIWRTDTIESEEELKKQMEVFADPVKLNALELNMAWEILLKSGYPLTTKIEKVIIDDLEVYSISDGVELLSLSQRDHHITESAIAKMIAMKPKRVIFLDKQFDGNDQLKTNTALQMHDAGVEFKMI